MSLSPLFSAPHQLFRPSHGHTKLELVPETAQLVSELSAEEGGSPSPLVVVSVVGTQRGGKSTLLNLLWGRQPGGAAAASKTGNEAGGGGFGLGHTMSAHTTGLWCWAKVHPRRPGTVMLLVDTEGLDSPHVPPSYNWTLSALALMVSTLFVYQTHRQIDAAATDRLGVILQVAQQLQKAESSGGTSESVAGASTLSGVSDAAMASKPVMLWLVRDHQLALTAGEPKDEMVQKLDQRNLGALRRCFRAYDCFLLPRPVHDDSQLRNVENMTFDDLVPEFREDYVVLERQILTAWASAPLTLPGTATEITGPTLAALCEHYARAVNSGQLSELGQLPTQRQMVLQLAGEKSVRVASEAYGSALAKVLAASASALSATDLLAAHREARGDAVDMFADGMYAEPALAKLMRDQGDDDLERLDGIDADTQEYYEQFRSKIASFESVPSLTSGAGRYLTSRELSSGLLADFWKQNYERSVQESEARLRELWEPISKRVEIDFSQPPGGEVGYNSVEEFDEHVQVAVLNALSDDPLAGVPGWEHSVTTFERKTIDSSRARLSDVLLRRLVFQGLTGLLDAARSDNAELREKITEAVFASGAELKEHVAEIAQGLRSDSTAAIAEAIDANHTKLSDEIQRVQSQATQASDLTDGNVRELVERMSAAESKIEAQAGELEAAGKLFAVSKEGQDANNEKFTQGLVALKELTTSALKESAVSVAALSSRTDSLDAAIKTTAEQSAASAQALEDKLSKSADVTALKESLAAQAEQIAMFERAFAGMDAQFDAMAAELRSKLRAECAEDARTVLEENDRRRQQEAEKEGSTVQHLKETCDALWSSVAGLSAKASDLEARVDENSRAVPEPDRSRRSFIRR